MKPKFLFLFFISSLCFNKGFAEHIVCASLRELILTSENIVYANVIDIKQIKQEGIFETHKAILVILEQL